MDVSSHPKIDLPGVKERGQVGCAVAGEERPVVFRAHAVGVRRVVRHDDERFRSRVGVDELRETREFDLVLRDRGADGQRARTGLNVNDLTGVVAELQSVARERKVGPQRPANEATSRQRHHVSLQEGDHTS